MHNSRPIYNTAIVKQDAAVKHTYTILYIYSLKLYKPEAISIMTAQIVNDQKKCVIG